MPGTSQVRVPFAVRLTRAASAASDFHSHPCLWQLEYVLVGPIRYEVRDATHRLGTGGLIVIPPGLAHRQESAASADSYMLRFEHPEADALRPGPTAVTLRADERPVAEALLAGLVAEHDGRAWGRERMIHALLSQLLVWIERWATRGIQAGPGAADDARDRVHAVADMLRRRYAEHFTIAELARQACLGRSRFMELFRQELGTSPGEFHRRVQMEKAVQLARHTGMTWEQIARHLGFNDPSYFSRAFKKVMGLSPSQYIARTSATE